MTCNVCVCHFVLGNILHEVINTIKALTTAAHTCTIDSVYSADALPSAVSAVRC